MSVLKTAGSPRVKFWLGSGLAALLIAALLNLFFIRFVHVPADDMRPGLKAGDLLLMNKCGTIKRDDIIAFYDPSNSMPERKGELFVQRCVALPGDYLKLEEGVLWVNDKKNENHIPLQFNYHIKTDHYDLDSILKKTTGVTEGGKISDEFDYSYSLTEASADSLLRNPKITLLERKVEKKDVRDDQIFPQSAHYNWNKYYMAPLLVPARGSTLLLDSVNIHLYEKLITVYEGNALERSGDSIKINGKATIRYTVKQDYYFVMGDNRDNAIDSRYWGFLPQALVAGKLWMIVKRK